MQAAVIFSQPLASLKERMFSHFFITFQQRRSPLSRLQSAGSTAGFRQPPCFQKFPQHWNGSGQKVQSSHKLNKMTDFTLRPNVFGVQCGAMHKVRDCKQCPDHAQTTSLPPDSWENSIRSLFCTLAPIMTRHADWDSLVFAAGGTTGYRAGEIVRLCRCRGTASKYE